MRQAALKSIRIREVTEADIGFVFNSWLKSYRYSFFAKIVPNSVYFSGHHKLMENLIHKGKLLIACNPEDPSQIYGYICAEHVQDILVVHYIYVKQTYRMLGVGKALLNQFDFDPTKASCFTHYSEIANKLAAKFNMIYHPYLMMNIYTNEDKDANTGEATSRGTLAINAPRSEESVETEVKE